MTTILDATSDARLFAPWFKDRATWQSWFSFLAALFALPMSDEQRQVFTQCTGRTTPPSKPVTEAWLICGRRAGKSFILALCAVFLAAFCDYRQFLAPGERGTIMVVARDKRQARVVLRFIRALITQVPLLDAKVERETAEGFDLINKVSIEVHVASFRSTRGYTIVAALLDEIAFWLGESSTDPDTEVVNAIRPGMSTIPNAMLLCASSPYARRGALWEAHRQHYGRDASPVLIWKAATRTMNPTVSQRVVDEAAERDPAFAAAEYLAEFRTDIESFISRDVIEALIQPGMFERPPRSNVHYRAFTDPSGGSNDSFTLAIAHRSADEQVELDLVREVRPPFSPESVVREFADVLSAYRITRVTGDRYAGEWPREQFRKYGIAYECSAMVKSEIYLNVLPLFNSRGVSLLDNARLAHQLSSLERRTSRAGRDSIDHGPNGHDDMANAAAGALLAAQNTNRQTICTGTYGYGGGRITWNHLESERCRIRSVKISEKLAPAARGA